MPRDLLYHSETQGTGHVVVAEAGRAECLACRSPLELVHSTDALDIAPRLQCQDHQDTRGTAARVFRHVDGTDCFRQSNVMRAPHANAVEAVAATLATSTPAASLFVEHRVTTPSTSSVPGQTTSDGGAGDNNSIDTHTSTQPLTVGRGGREGRVVRSDGGGRANAVLTTDLAFHAPRDGLHLAVEVFDESSYLSLYRRVTRLFAAGYAVMLVFCVDGKYNPDRIESHLTACRGTSQEGSGDVDVPIRVGRYRDAEYSVSLGTVLSPRVFDPEWLRTGDLPAYMV